MQTPRQETVTVLETVLFTNLNVKELEKCKLWELAPFLDFIAGEHNLKVKVTAMGIVALNKDLDKCREILENSICYN